MLKMNRSVTRATDSTGLLVGAVGIEIASLTSKSFNTNGVAPPPLSNWSHVEPRDIRIEIIKARMSFSLCGYLE
jgi:hypothetical protein